MSPPSDIKTIFITSFHGQVSRILECGILDYLQKNNDVRVVLFVPHFKKKYFEETFGRRNNLSVEGIKRKALPRRAFVFHKLSFVLLDTDTMRLTRKSFRGYSHFYETFLAQSAASLFGRWRWGREFFRWINCHFSGRAVFEDYFEKYKPDAVFSTDIKDMLDTALLIEAKKRHIKTIGMVRSWDYLTGKGLVRSKPDKLIVHNNTIKQEAMRYVDMSEKDISVTGLPHFDPYIQTTRVPRESFFSRIGVDPAKRLIFYAPWGDKFLNTDWEFLTLLTSAIEAGELPQDTHVLVRLPPNDTVYLDQLQQTKLITIDAPGTRFDNLPRKANELTYNDILQLADSLYWSSVVVTPPSTIVIDACALDKPVVLMAFDGNREKGYYEGIKHYYDFNHIRNLIRQGGAVLAKNKKELITHINMYLQDPTITKEGRANVVREQCFKLDGQSSKRLADFLFSQL